MRRERNERGPPFVGRNDGPPPEPVPDEAPPRTLRERFRKVRGDARAMFAILPRAFGVVWSANRGLTVALALIAILSGVVPTATAWVSKLLIDAVVTTARGGAAAEIRHVIWLVVAQLDLYLGNSLLQTLRGIDQQALQELTANRVQLTIMEHANRLDLAFFENPRFYDMLQQAQREASPARGHVCG